MIGKKIIKNLYFIFTILTITCNLFLPNVSADTVIIKPEGDGNRTSNKESACGTAKNPNYPFHGCGNFDSYFAVRVTLIDQNFVKKSRTIEFRNSKDGKTRNVTGQVAIGTTYTPMTDLIPTSYKENVTSQDNVNVLFEDLKPGYNVFGGSSFFDSGGASSNQLVYETRLYDRTSTDEYNLNLRRTDFIKYVTSLNKMSEQENGDKVSFLELFLKLSVNENVTIQDLANQKYSLLIEPVQQVFYRENNDDVKVVEGTTKQLTAFIYKNFKERYNVSYSFGKWSTIRGTQIFNYACSFYAKDDFSGKHGVGNVCDSTKNFLSKFGGFFASSTDLSTHLVKNGYNNILLETIISSDNLYGANIIKLDEIVDKGVNLNCNLVINYCDANDNKGINYDMRVIDSEGRDVTDTYLNLCIENSSKIYTTSDETCIQTGNYDVSGIIESFNSIGKINLFTYVKVPSVDVDLINHCYDTASRDPFNSLSISIKIFGNTYVSKFSLHKTTRDSYGLAVGGRKREDRFITGDYSFNDNSDIYYYFPGNKKPGYIYISDKLTNTDKEENYINFDSISDGFLFGTNNGLMKTLRKNGNSISVDATEIVPGGSSTTYNLKYNLIENGSSKKCYFTPEIDDDCGSDCSPYGEKIKFRVISLSYPFPSKDGNSRLPGLNWMNEYNYVYKYITNNRNIQSTSSSGEIVNPENIYLDKEPLYTIKLDAPTMLKIRQYNRYNPYEYGAGYNFECTDGKMCYSNFLRDTSIISELNGTCKNKNNFYGCADKTEESGG